MRRINARNCDRRDCMSSRSVARVAGYVARHASEEIIRKEFDWLEESC